MTASFTLVLDTAPPANPGLLINGGAALTGSVNSLLTIATTDYGSGAADVAQMKIWGDVDSSADPLVQPTEAGSAWRSYTPTLVVALAAGSGRKTLYARLRDDVGNETVPFSDFIDLNTDIPTVSITTPVDRGRISKVAGYDTALFTWECDRDFVHYEVRVVPSEGSPAQAGVLIGTAGGSGNTSGDGVFAAATPITTAITGADLEAASPGDTAKIAKVFTRDGSGAWSA